MDVSVAMHKRQDSTTPEPGIAMKQKNFTFQWIELNALDEEHGANQLTIFLPAAWRFAQPSHLSKPHHMDQVNRYEFC